MTDAIGFPHWSGLPRLALAAGWALMLAPVAAQGLWRPLVVGLGGHGDARAITVAALLVAVAAIVGHAREPVGARLRWGAAISTAVLSALLLGGGPPAIVAAMLALVTVAALVSATLPILFTRIPAQIDAAPPHPRWVMVAVLVVGSIAVIQTARLSVFMGDADRVGFTALPLLEHLNFHACSTSYFQAAKLAALGVDNLYDASWWPALASSGLVHAEPYAPFDLDTFAYPPPFLLLPHALTLISDDFAVQRALWFGLNGLFLLFALWFAAVWIGERDGKAGLRALMLAPLVWVTFPNLVTLQVGNVHMVVIAMAVVAMIAFDRQRPALGGALLAFAILAKVSPGLLGVVLLVQRRWREALWTAGFGLVWSALGLLAFGLAPFEAFVVYELPRLSSGEALAFFADRIDDIALNMAPFGLPFKLEALGLGFDDVWATARALNSVFGLVVVALTIVAARRTDGDRRVQLAVVLAVLTLGSLESPFAPAYVGFSALWLLSLEASAVERAGGVVALALGFLLFNGLPPLPDVPTLMISIVSQLVLLGLVAWVIARPSHSPAASNVSQTPGSPLSYPR